MAAVGGGLPPRPGSALFFDARRVDDFIFRELGIRGAPKVGSSAEFEVALKRYFGCNTTAAYGEWKRVPEVNTLLDAEILYAELGTKVDRFATGFLNWHAQKNWRLETRFLVHRAVSFLMLEALDADVNFRGALKSGGNWTQTVALLDEVIEQVDAELTVTAPIDSDRVRGEFLIERIVCGDEAGIMQFSDPVQIAKGIEKVTTLTGAGDSASTRSARAVIALAERSALEPDLGLLVLESVPEPTLRHWAVVPEIRRVLAGIEDEQVRFALKPSRSPDEVKRHKYFVKIAAILKPYKDLPTGP